MQHLNSHYREEDVVNAAATEDLLQLRTERGVSTQALADAIGVHVQTIGYIERRR